MADPHHEETLDAHDRRTVALYRGGVAIAAAGLVLLAGLLATGRDGGPGVATVLGGTLLAIVHLHLYDKRVRWVIQVAGGLGAWGVAVGALTGVALVGQAGLGFLFVALSGLALKERFCFKIPGLNLVPVLLAGSLVPLVLGIPWGAAALLLLGAAPLAVLVVAKLRQPLHYDIGDRRRYQV